MENELERSFMFSGTTTGSMVWAVDFGNGSTRHPSEQDVKERAVKFILYAYEVEVSTAQIIISVREVFNEQDWEDWKA